MLLTKGSRIARWLRANCRYFGVAALAYAALHTWVYVVGEGSFSAIMAETSDFDIWTGWLAFAIFIPLAATSMDYAVRKLGIWWKPLQRWTYAAAVLTLLHWASLHNWNGWLAPTINFAPLGPADALSPVMGLSATTATGGLMETAPKTNRGPRRFFLALTS